MWWHNAKPLSVAKKPIGSQESDPRAAVTRVDSPLVATQLPIEELPSQTVYQEVTQQELLPKNVKHKRLGGDGISGAKEDNRQKEVICRQAAEIVRLQSTVDALEEMVVELQLETGGVDGINQTNCDSHAEQLLALQESLRSTEAKLAESEQKTLELGKRFASRFTELEQELERERQARDQIASQLATERRHSTGLSAEISSLKDRLASSEQQRANELARAEQREQEVRQEVDELRSQTDAQAEKAQGALLGERELLAASHSKLQALQKQVDASDAQLAVSLKEQAASEARLSRLTRHHSSEMERLISSYTISQAAASKEIERIKQERDRLNRQLQLGRNATKAANVALEETRLELTEQRERYAQLVSEAKSAERDALDVAAMVKQREQYQSMLLLSALEAQRQKTASLSTQVNRLEETLVATEARWRHAVDVEELREVNLANLKRRQAAEVEQLNSKLDAANTSSHKYMLAILAQEEAFNRRTEVHNQQLVDVRKLYERSSANERAKSIRVQRAQVDELNDALAASQLRGSQLKQRASELEQRLANREQKLVEAESRASASENALLDQNKQHASEREQLCVSIQNLEQTVSEQQLLIHQLEVGLEREKLEASQQLAQIRQTQKETEQQAWHLLEKLENDCGGELCKLDSTIVSLEQQLIERQSSYDSVASALTQVEQETDKARLQLETRIRQLEQQLIERQSSYDSVASALAQVEQETDKARLQLETRLRQLEAELIERQSSYDSVASALTQVEQETDKARLQLETRLRQLEAELIERQSSYDSVASALTQVEQETDKARLQLETRLRQLEEELIERQSSYDSVASALAQLEQEADKARLKLESRIRKLEEELTESQSSYSSLATVMDRKEEKARKVHLQLESDNLQLKQELLNGAVALQKSEASVGGLRTSVQRAIAARDMLVAERYDLKSQIIELQGKCKAAARTASEQQTKLQCSLTKREVQCDGLAAQLAEHERDHAQQMLELKRALDDSEARLQEDAKRLEDLQEELKRAGQQHHNQLRQSEDDQARLTARIRELERNLLELRRERAETENQLVQLREERVVLVADAETARRSIERLTNENASVKLDLDTCKLQFRKEQQALFDDKQIVEAELARAETEYRKRLCQYEDRYESLKNKLAAEEESRRALESSMGDKVATIDALHAELENTQRQIREQAAARRKAEGTLKRAGQKADATSLAQVSLLHYEAEQRVERLTKELIATQQLCEKQRRRAINSANRIERLSDQSNSGSDGPRRRAG